jgi:hypothetical protein
MKPGHLNGLVCNSLFLSHNLVHYPGLFDFIESHGHSERTGHSVLFAYGCHLAGGKLFNFLATSDLGEALIETKSRSA